MSILTKGLTGGAIALLTKGLIGGEVAPPVVVGCLHGAWTAAPTMRGEISVSSTLRGTLEELC